MRRWSVAVGLVALVGLVGAACGDDDDGGGGTLTQAQFVERGNAICEQGGEEFDQLFETGFPSTPDKLTTFFAEATKITERQVTAFKDLGAAEGQEEQYDELIRLGELVVADFRAASEDIDKAGELFQAEGGENSAALERHAGEMGLAECAEDEDEGGEEEDGVTLLDPATFSPEKRAFVEQADAICGATLEQERALETEYLATFPPPLEDWEKFLSGILELNRPNVEKLRALTPPAGDEAAVQAVLDEMSSVLDQIEELAGLAAAGDADAFDERLNTLFPRFDEVEEMAAAYGFQVCGIETDD